MERLTPHEITVMFLAVGTLLTAAKVDFGVLTLASTPVTPPATVDLPGPVDASLPLGIASPPPPPPTPSATASAP